MNRSALWVCLAASLLSSVGFAAKKNIVVFVTDDQSPDAGCYGNKVIKTPNLDKLAADAVLFRQAFCTTASCSASRSVILTGLHNHANGHYGHQHSYHKFSSFPWVKTLPVMLNKLGYRTARAGKHHNAPEEVYYFENKIPGNARSPVVLAENCSNFINADDERPFFLYFATSDPHRGGGFANELPHKPDRFGNRPNRGAYPKVNEIFYDPQEVLVPKFLPDTPTCRAEIAQYYQSISRIDQGLGRLIEILKNSGQWEDTIFLYTSDHGMAFPGGKTTVYEAGLRVPFIIRNPYQAKRGIENDAMVSLVDITPTMIDFVGGFDRAKRTVDPKVAELVQRRRGRTNKKPYKLHGRSILPVLDQEHPKGWDLIHASHTFHEITMYYPMRVVRDRRYKIIWNIAHELPYPFASDLWAAPTWQAQYKQGLKTNYGRCTVGQYINRAEFELFDISQDPLEQKNLATDPKYAAILDEYKDKIRLFQKQYGDPWILKWKYE